MRIIIEIDEGRISAPVPEVKVTPTEIASVATTPLAALAIPAVDAGAAMAITESLVEGVPHLSAIQERSIAPSAPAESAGAAPEL
jgi:hypothetical protein